MKKLVNGTEVELTAEEIAKRRADEAVWASQTPTIDDYRFAIEAHVDAVATERNYASGVSCASYKDSTEAQWAAEAATFIAWRDALWLYVYAELDKVQNGQREQPTIEAFIAELEPIAWPQ